MLLCNDVNDQCIRDLFSTQTSLGAEMTRGATRFNFNAFLAKQTNLPAVDPIDRNYLVNLGTIRSEGATLSGVVALNGEGAFADTGNEAWLLDGSITRQRARVVQRTSATQGAELPGVPAGYGSVRLTRNAHPYKAWVALVGTGERPGDGNGSFKAPGYLRTDVGLSFAWQTNTQVDLSCLNLADLRYVQALSAPDNVWQGNRRRFTATLTHSF